MSEAHDAAGGSRREFLKRVAVAGVAAAVTPASELFAQTAAAPAPAAAPPAAPAAAAAADTASDEARALAAVLEKRYGDRLSKEQWESVAGDLDGDLAAGKRLGSVKLANGDEPDFAFKA